METHDRPGPKRLRMPHWHVSNACVHEHHGECKQPKCEYCKVACKCICHASKSSVLKPPLRGAA
jgi:hypothetical protein